MVKLSKKNLIRLIGDLNGRGGVDEALYDCWEFLPEEWADLWEEAVDAARSLDPIPEVES